MNELLICELCASSSLDVRTGLACYADDGRFERIDRCTDHRSCRQRVEADGSDWPLLDITDSTRQGVAQ